VLAPYPFVFVFVEDDEAPEFDDTFIFLVFELELEPLGVLRTVILDLVPVPAYI